MSTSLLPIDFNAQCRILEAKPELKCSSAAQAQTKAGLGASCVLPGGALLGTYKKR